MPMLTAIRADGGTACTGSSTPALETRERRCPACSSDTIAMAPGHMLADATGDIWIEYRCDACAMPFWLLHPFACSACPDAEPFLPLGLATTAASSPAPNDAAESGCPHCRISDWLAPRQVVADRTGVWAKYQCRACGTTVWRPCPVRRLGRPPSS